jgi:hypothetical protein
MAAYEDRQGAHAADGAVEAKTVAGTRQASVKGCDRRAMIQGVPDSKKN